MAGRFGEKQRMQSVAQVRIHASQFPESVRRDLVVSLRTRQVNPKFHYDSVKQAQRWLAVHEAHSPWRRVADCRRIYERGFAAAALVATNRVQVIGLGCGDGQKDARLLARLQARGKTVRYTPCDVSPALVLKARRAALRYLPADDCTPLVCDLAKARDLADALFPARPAPGSRVFTFFGMLPNFEPREILPRVAGLVRPGDWLLVSANLAPGPDYAAGMRRILPQYDNTLTREWLLTFLFDLGVGQRDGKLHFRIEEDADSGLKRVTATYHFVRGRKVTIGGETFDFRNGDAIRLFFSYRYTVELLREMLGRHGLEICGEWVTRSEEEGVFLCRRRR